MARLIRFSVSLLLASMLSSASVAAAEYESPRVVLASDIVPRPLLTSPTHRVEPKAKVAQNLLEVVLFSDFGLFDITSVALLEIRVHELSVLDQAIAQYQRAGGAGLRRSGSRSPGGGQVSTLSAPRGPASHLSTTLSDNDAILASRGPRVLRSGYRGPARPTATGPIFESHRRNVAYHLGLDPYSTNTHVQNFLAKVADARAKGQFSAGSGLVLRPAVRSSRLVDGGRIDQEVQQLLRHLELPELRSGLEAEIPKMGVSDNIVARFLEHGSYTPSMRASMAAHIDFLGTADGLEAFFGAALGARSESEALSFEQLARMLALYHEHVGKITKLIPGGRALPGALRADGALVLMLPVDYVYWTPSAERIFESLRQAEGRTGRPIELVVRGTLSPTARKELAAREVTVREGFLATLPQG